MYNIRIQPGPHEFGFDIFFDIMLSQYLMLFLNKISLLHFFSIST